MGKLNINEEKEFKNRTTTNQQNNMIKNDLLNEENNFKLIVNNNLINNKLPQDDLNLEADKLNDNLKKMFKDDTETDKLQNGNLENSKEQIKFKEIDLKDVDKLDQQNNGNHEENKDQLTNESLSSNNILSNYKLDAHSGQNEILTNSIKLFRSEFKRMGFNERYWRYTSFNKDFTLCSTYPPYFIIPVKFADKDLFQVAKFRHIGRLPSVVYRHKNGAVIVRSSQPSVGLLGRRSIEDEKLLDLIYFNCIEDQNQILEQLNTSDSLPFDENNKLTNELTNSSNCVYCFKNNSFSNKLDSLTSSSTSLTNNNNNQDQKAEKYCICRHNNNNKDAINSVNCQPTQQSSKFFSLPDKIFENIMSYAGYNDNGNDDSNQKPTSSSSTSSDKQKQNLNKKLLIFDARSFTVAFLNRAFGGGSECSEYYPNCEVEFLYLANIHAVRTAFLSLKSFVRSDSNTNQPIPNNNYFGNWAKSNSTYWLYYISNLIESALKVVKAIDQEAKPVLIHCSDGWDRTAQISSLAELLLDPFYRTIEGFKVLVQREWLDFGHKFADRCGVCPVSKNVNERSPIFVQWLDCVYQIVRQCPDYFEFNCTYLEELALHTYSPLFGTFSCNSYLERFINQIHGETTSVWAYLEKSREKFINENYIDTVKVLEPLYVVDEMIVWRDLYKKLITDEFESRFDLKNTNQFNSNFITRNPQVNDSNSRKKKLRRTNSFTNLNQSLITNQQTKNSKEKVILRKVKSDSDLYITINEKVLKNKSKNLDDPQSSCPSNSPQSKNYNDEFKNQSKNLNFLFSDRRLDPQPNSLNNPLNSSNGSLNGTCKFESTTNRGFDTENLQYQAIPLSVISKIAQIANSGNPDSSLMYSILTYISSVNTLHTFSVK